MRDNFYLCVRLNLLCILLILSAFNTKLQAQTPDSVIFRDDFNQDTLGDLWQKHDSWSIVNGSAYNFIDGIGGYLKTSATYSDSSYIIVTAAMGFTSNYYREFRITFGQADLSNDELYQVRYTAYGGGRLTLSRSSDNIYFPEVLDEVAVFPSLSSTAWYRFKIERYKSGLIQVYIDKGAGYGATPLLEAIDVTYGELGHAGWQVDTQTFAEDFYVDWISARKPGEEKPATREKPAEDDLITQVSAESGKAYKVSKLAAGVKQLTDRDYVITSVPEYLNGASFIQAANDDKLYASDSFLTFFIKRPALVYVAYDSRATTVPDWLASWHKTGDQIGTSDEKAGYLNVYSKLVEGLGQVYPYPLILGGNYTASSSDAQTHYLVAAITRPAVARLQAEDALLSGAVVANNHQNYNGTGFADFKNPENDYIEWSVQITVPGTYNVGFTFAHAGSKNRSLQISDNGVNVGTADFSPVSTSWSAWAFLSGPNVFLSAGSHKIRVTATGSSGPNIDELSLFFLSDSPPPAGTSAPMMSRDHLPPNETAGNALPQHYKAYPNPFLQKTTLIYTLKEKAKVALSIFTIDGKQIQRLINGIKEAGNYQVVFDAGRLPKGIYIYRLQIGERITTGKLIKE